MNEPSPEPPEDWAAALTGEQGDDMQFATMKVFIQQHVDTLLGRVRFVPASPDTAVIQAGDEKPPVIFQP